MDGSDFEETRDVVLQLSQRDLASELAQRAAPLCYSKIEKREAKVIAPRYDLLVAAVTVSAAVGFVTLCLAIA